MASRRWGIHPSMLLALTIASWRPWGPRGDGAGAPGPLFFQCSKVFGPDRRGARGRPARAESSLITSPATGGQFGGGLGGAYGGVDRPGRRGGLAGQHSGGDRKSTRLNSSHVEISY